MKTKLEMAHDWAMNCLKSGLTASMVDLVTEAWEYADAMYAEAEEREDKTRPEVLCEVDWNIAPVGAYRYEVSNTKSIWLVRDGVYTREVSAPSFGLTGSHIVERSL